VRAAFAALAVSVLLLLWTAVRAARLDDTPDAPVAAFDASAPIAAVTTTSKADIGAAVQNDIFAPDRSAPESPYRLPGESNDDRITVVEVPPPVVLGTALVGSDHNFATIQLGESAPVIVRVGDRAGPFTVKTIARGRVSFTDATGKLIDVPALKAGTQ
jgi:hypothetical protein